MYKNKEDNEWCLAGEKLGVVDKYVYLGLEIGREGIGRSARKRLSEKARRALWKMWNLVGRERGLSVLGKVRVWQTMVQSILETGGEVMRDVQWREAEMLQMKMGKMIVGVESCNDVVRGD